VRLCQIPRFPIALQRMPDVRGPSVEPCSFGAAVFRGVLAIVLANLSGRTRPVSIYRSGE
jgi:hypothetical protein